MDKYCTVENGLVLLCEKSECSCGAVMLLNKVTVVSHTIEELIQAGYEQVTGEVDEDSFDPDEDTCDNCR